MAIFTMAILTVASYTYYGSNLYYGLEHRLAILTMAIPTVALLTMAKLTMASYTYYGYSLILWLRA